MNMAAYKANGFTKDGTSGHAFVSVSPSFCASADDSISHVGVMFIMTPADARALAADLLAAADHADGDEPMCFAVNHRKGGEGPWACYDNNLTEAEARALFADRETLCDGHYSGDEWQIVREVPVATEAK
jgi:hypothetical protein